MENYYSKFIQLFNFFKNFFKNTDIPQKRNHLGFLIFARDALPRFLSWAPVYWASLIWVVSFTLVTLLRHMCSPTKLFDVDAPWIVRRSTFLLVAFQNWHFYLKTRSYWHLQILFIYVMSANEMKKNPTTSTSKSLPGEEYVRQQFMLYL